MIDWKAKLTSLLLTVSLSSVVWAAPSVQTFPSPEAAAKALYAALQAKDVAALNAMFGPDFKKVEATEPAERAATRTRLTRLFKEGWSLTTTQDQHRVIRMGYEGWSFPIPLIKKGSLWQFDVALGLEEIANRRVGRNELMAIDTANNVYRAQQLYHKQNGQYAAQLVSSPAQKNGLYWPSTGAADISPLQQVIGDIAALTSTHTKGRPWYGYYYSFHLTKDGYTFAAWPQSYKTSGIMSFWCDQSGRLYEKDLGANGGAFLRGMDATSNLQGWNLVSQ